MSIKFWAIGDLHLSFAKPRDFTRYGEKWFNHTLRIEKHWRERVAPQDVVLLVGDISWASTRKRVLPDLKWLDELPGRKVMVRGNHDRWWRDISEVRRSILPESIYALQGDCIALAGVLLCGAQGHIAPNDPYYRPDPPVNRYERELSTLQLALDQAAAMRTGGQPLIIMTHYPPFTSEGKPTAYSDLIEQHAPAQCLYGHLHKEQEWQTAVNSYRAGIQYSLLSADYLDMTPQQIYPRDSLTIPHFSGERSYAK